jgi:hypothetical protein
MKTTIALNLLLFISILFFQACEKEEEKVKGIWQVLSIDYQGKSLFGSVYTDNGLYMVEGNSITLPNSYLYYQSDEYRKGTWELLPKENGLLRLRIITKDTFLNNIYTVRFYQESRYKKYLLLESKKVVIKCVKA